jgi:hypothetical protein
MHFNLFQPRQSSRTLREFYQGREMPIANDGRPGMKVPFVEPNNFGRMLDRLLESASRLFDPP